MDRYDKLAVYGREICRLELRVRNLEALLTELIDIEGPQPGHVMWAKKVAAALGATLSGEAKP